MNISFQAFHWNSTCSKLDINQFLPLMRNKQTNYTIGNREIYVLDNGKNWVGLVITIKDMRNFCKIVKHKGTIKLLPHELEANENVADFNFFILNKKKQYGMYQHYHQSCSLNVFNCLVKKRFNEIKTKIKNQKRSDLEEKELSEVKINEILKSYNGKIEQVIVERKGTFENRIKKMKDIGKISFEFASIDSLSDPFVPIAGVIKKANHTVSLSSHASATSKKQAIARFLKQYPMKKAAIEGEDENGHDVIYRLFNDYDKFATFDYDDMVPSLSLDSKNIESSIRSNKIIHELERHCTRIFS